MESSNFGSVLSWYHRALQGSMIGPFESKVSPVFNFTVIKSQLIEAFPDPPTPDLSIQLVKPGVQHEVNVDVGHGKFSSRDSGAYKFAVGPANVPLDFRGAFSGTLTVLAVPWQNAQMRLQALLQSPVEHLGILHTRMNEDLSVARSIESLWLHVNHDEHLGRLVVDDLLNDLLLRLVTLSGKRIPTVSSSCRLSTHQLCHVIDYMVSHLGEFIELDQLADVAGVNRFQLCRLFKNSTGQSPARYLRCLRIEQAERMLLDNRNRPLIDIALECGFCDQAHFNRVFKSILGITPKAYLMNSR